ncbi:SDR family NAD(P)-dependent oxidoreductase [Phenylobacterium sp.]|uniref:SDR family NAD(P)-dependent oxidoreductase n=1 Tax=Phenylobacterium sp. TaxID=1871053 RepID=UPI002736FA8A|nr:SDR family NAD(P)-dependent oxidoreductase [Phenylobacterium sp.]MDP3659822.1 SDR family NAD(P)-dependent oxidoreductase [Phenylobacterium sp.]
MKDLDFSGKRALVVGGSSGIGNGVAHAFLDRGAVVHVTGTRASADQYDPASGSDLTGLNYSQLNVSDTSAVESWTPTFDSLDILVLCQGVVEYRRAEFQMETFRRVVEVNLNSLMACAVKFQPMLAKAKGSLITVSSAGGIRTTRGNPAYAASKAGVIHLTATLADAWAGQGIRVNGVAPGLVATKMTEVTVADPERLAERLKGIPIGRLGEIREIAGVVLFLASPLSGYVVGQTIVSDGGRTLSS